MGAPLNILVPATQPPYQAVATFTISLTHIAALFLPRHWTELILIKLVTPGPTGTDASHVLNEVVCDGDVSLLGVRFLSTCVA